MIKLTDIKVAVELGFDGLKQEIANIVCLPISSIGEIKILKQSIDSRQKPNIFYVFSVAVELKEKLKIRRRFEEYSENLSDYYFSEEKLNYSYSPIVVGCGPAGMFCAYRLALAGLKPILIERGKDADSREKDINNLMQFGELNPESNILFGEGGAGTFSDGKLTTGTNSPHIKKLLRTFVECGAPQQIEYLSKPHIGSDNLKNVVKNLRRKIIQKGGTVLFEHKLENINIENGKIESVVVQTPLGEKIFKTQHLVLAIGHSARDTLRMLNSLNFEMQPKAFSMGVRVEHDRELINQSQYGKDYFKGLPTADYKLSAHFENNRSAYTFCMCPGGVVVPAMHQNGTINVNGMSYFSRNEKNSNSALLVNVTPDDFMYGTNVLSGIDFQESWERKAYELANPNGNTFNAPVQTIEEFLGKKCEKYKTVIPSYKPNTVKCDLHNCLPDFVSETLELALTEFNKKIKGFASSTALLTGIETRSSSPVRVLRGENRQSTNILGVYPCGEGCGYAGGIVSAGVDGINTAEQIIEQIRINIK